MNEARAPRPVRFLVRQGPTRWMVYDRERKGPARFGQHWAANLTREEAERIQQSLADAEDERVS